MDIIASVVLPACGGLGVQLMNFLELRNIPKTERPDFKEFVYWIPCLIAPIIGGFIGFAYFHDVADVNYLLSIHIGASAPIILRTFASNLPTQLR